MGKFYNPKYNQSVDGFGIWDNKMYGTFSGIVGKFDYINKEGVTADNEATGIILADGMIQWVLLAVQRQILQDLSVHLTEWVIR